LTLTATWPRRLAEMVIALFWMSTYNYVAGRQVQTVRSLNAGLPEGDNSLHVVETVSGGVEECAKKCDAMAPEKCRSFNYDKEGKVCNLLYLDGKTTLRPQVKNGIDLYDMHCLTGKLLTYYNLQTFMFSSAGNLPNQRRRHFLTSFVH
jgi:hypothetical protein